MTKSERLRRRIVWHLRYEWVWMEGGNCWRGFDALADELSLHINEADVTVPMVKREVRRMAKLGRLEHSVMSNQDGCPCGSGYFFVGSWWRHEPGRAEDPAPDEFEVWEAA